MPFPGSLKIRQLLRISGYWRTVALVFSGTAFAQMFPLLGSLVIARLFIPAEFGFFTAWLGITALAGVFITGRFEMALILVDDGAPRSEAMTATVITTALVLCLLSIAGGLAYPFIIGQLSDVPAGLIWLFIPSVGAVAAVQIWQARAAADGRFRVLTSMRIVQAAAVTGFQILGGWIWPTATSLALAYVVGVVLSLITVGRRLPLGRLPQGWQSVFQFWVRFRRFPMFALPADTMNTAAVQLPLTILASRFGAETAGFVALAFRTLSAPIALLGTAVLDVFKRRASESWRAIGSCRGPFVETFLVLAAGSLVATVIFGLAGEQLFVLAFGERWREAGTAGVILLPLFALRFVASPLSFTFYIAEKQHIDLIWQIGLFAMTLMTLTQFEHYQSALKAYAFGYGFFYLIYVALSYRFSAGKRA